MTVGDIVERAFEWAGKGVVVIILAAALVVSAPFMVLGWAAARLGIVR